MNFMSIYVNLQNYCAFMCDVEIIYCHLKQPFLNPTSNVAEESFSFLPSVVGMGIQSFNLKRIFGADVTVSPLI